MASVKRSVKIIALGAALIVVPVSAQGASQSPAPHPARSGNGAAQNQARQAARSALEAALSQAQNGRDLAFADADATLMQSLQSAGKDSAVRQAARAAYKAAANGIISVYKQALKSAKQNYRAALAAIK